MNSDAVFHEESEYVIRFIIRVDKNALSFFAKKENLFIVFHLYLYENRVKLENNYYQNDQRQILYTF